MALALLDQGQAQLEGEIAQFFLAGETIAVLANSSNPQISQDANILWVEHLALEDQVKSTLNNIGLGSLLVGANVLNHVNTVRQLAAMEGIPFGDISWYQQVGMENWTFGVVILIASAIIIMMRRR
jgi:hypothetical protein